MRFAYPAFRLPATVAALLSLAAGADAGAQDPLPVARVTCERGEGAACVPAPGSCETASGAVEPCAAPVKGGTDAPPRANVTELRDWQVAYFRRGDGARLVAAFDVSTNRVFWQFLAAWGTTTLGGAPPGEWKGGVFVLPGSDGDPASGFGTELLIGAPQAKWSGTVTVPWAAALVGFELVAPEDPAAPIAIVRNGAVGRGKVEVAPPPQPAQRLQISDILVYEHDGHATPRALDGPQGAAARALGTTTLGGRQRVGLYWEVYGLTAGEAARMELTIAPVVDRSTSSLGVSPVGVAWEAGAIPAGDLDGGWAQGFILNVATLRPGRHNMLVTVSVPGEEPVTAVRPITVVVGG